MKSQRLFLAVAVLFLITGTVHAQVIENLVTQGGRTFDFDTVVITPKLKWFADSMCIVMEVREHRERLEKFTKMPDLYFTNLNKRLQTNYTRAELISIEKEKIALAENKYPFYRKEYEASLVASK